jgi:hypothetical protein
MFRKGTAPVLDPKSNETLGRAHRHLLSAKSGYGAYLLGLLDATGRLS